MQHPTPGPVRITNAVAALLVFELVSLTAALGQAASLTQMSCGNAAALVHRQGAVVLHTGPMTYARFVSGGNSCLGGETPEPAWARTSDNPQFFVGYRCRDVDLDNGQ